MNHKVGDLVVASYRSDGTYTTGVIVEEKHGLYKISWVYPEHLASYNHVGSHYNDDDISFFKKSLILFIKTAL